MLMVSTPTSDALCIDVIYKLCVVKITGRELEVDLILLDIRDFDVISGVN